MPIGTPVHERTLALCESLNYREWSGYYAVSAYESHHEHEYNAIRNAAALIDVSPLFKYLVTGPDAARLVDRVITRDVAKMGVGQVYYTPWCDEYGKVIDDGTVSRLGDQTFRWTAADPSLRWLRLNAAGLAVDIEDISEETAALALQGPTSARLLRAVSNADIDRLKYFRVTRGDHRRRSGRDLAHRLHGRSRLRDLDAGVRRGARLGRDHGRRPSFRRQACRHARARRRPRRSRAAPDRRRLLRQQEGDDRIAEVHAVRDGARTAGRAGQGAIRRPASARGRAAARPGPPGRRPRARLDRRRAHLRAARAAADGGRDRLARCGPRLSRQPPGRPGDDDDVVAGAQEDDRAGDDRAAKLRAWHPARVRSDGRSRAAPRQRHRRRRRRSSIRPARRRRRRCSRSSGLRASTRSRRS